MNTPEERAAYVVSQAMSALIEAMAMRAENDELIRCGNDPKWSGEHFRDLISSYGIHHNAVLGILRS